jgi:hypothetical protein
VIAVLKAFGLPTVGCDLAAAREFFSAEAINEHTLRVFQAAGVRDVVMTNDPPFAFPADTLESTILSEAVLPSCREFDLPLSLMIAVRYQVNPSIRLAGDGAFIAWRICAGIIRITGSW